MWNVVLSTLIFNSLMALDVAGDELVLRSPNYRDMSISEVAKVHPPPVAIQQREKMGRGAFWSLTNPCVDYCAQDGSSKGVESSLVVSSSVFSAPLSFSPSSRPRSSNRLTVAVPCLLAWARGSLRRRFEGGVSYGNAHSSISQSIRHCLYFLDGRNQSVLLGFCHWANQIELET